MNLRKEAGLVLAGVLIAACSPEGPRTNRVQAPTPPVVTIPDTRLGPPIQPTITISRGELQHPEWPRQLIPPEDRVYSVTNIGSAADAGLRDLYFINSIYTPLVGVLARWDTERVQVRSDIPIVERFGWQRTDQGEVPNPARIVKGLPPTFPPQIVDQFAAFSLEKFVEKIGAEDILPSDTFTLLPKPGQGVPVVLVLERNIVRVNGVPNEMAVIQTHLSFPPGLHPDPVTPSLSIPRV